MKTFLSSLARRSLLALALFTSLFLALPASQAQEIELFYTDQTDLDWNDAGSGAKTDVSFWRARYPAGQNIEAFCHIGRPLHSQNPGMVVAKKLTGTAFAYPVGFTLIWQDSGTGASLSGYFWRPVPPTGYRTLGDVVTGSSTAPALTSVVCVRSDLCVEASIGELLWSSAYTGANTNSNSWNIVAPVGAINIGAFAANGSYDPPAGPFYCLRASAVVPLPVPTNAELEQLISQYGPQIRFHPDEPFLPDDPAAILNDPNTHLSWGTVFPVNGVDFNRPGEGYTDADKYEFDHWSPSFPNQRTTSASTILDDVQSVLANPKANDPHFSYQISYSRALKPGNLSRAKAYVRVQPYQGVLTELQFWMFCPYNGAGHSHLTIAALVLDELLDPTGTMGEHFSDWEEVHVRISTKNVWTPGVSSLASAVLSRHSGVEEVAGSDPRLAHAIPGGRPIIYPGIRTHANYLSTGTQVYDPAAHTGFVHVELYDVTGDGPVWNLWDSAQHMIVSSAWPSVATTTPEWLFFGGRMGDYLKNQYTVRVEEIGIELFTEYQREIGTPKPGLIRRSLWDVTYPYNANLGSLHVSGGALSPAFNPQLTAYTMALPTGVKSMTITPQAADYHARIEVRVNGRPYPLIASGVLLGKKSVPLALNVGSNTVEIMVTAPAPPAPEVATVKTYTLTVAVTAPRIVVEQPAGTPLLGATVVGWGENGLGQTTPPANLGEVSALAVGDQHTLALKSDGTVLAWGSNYLGQASVPPSAQSGVSAIACGISHSVALKNDGTVVAWGDNFWGQTNVPPGLNSVIAIAAGGAFAVALKNDGTVVTWGNTVYLGTVPAGLSEVIAITAGVSHIAALQRNGAVVAWGSNESGKTTVPLEARSGVIAIAAGGNHTLALKNNGSVVAWGDNTFGQCTVPAAQQFNSGIAIAAGRNHSVVLNSNGSVLAWGSNSRGQTLVPLGLTSVSQTGTNGIAIAAGENRSFAVVRSTHAVDFGNRVTNGSPPGTQKTFTFKNTGNSPLTISYLTGQNTNGFDASIPFLQPATIPVGGQFTYTVGFSPVNTAGPRSSILGVGSDDADRSTIDIPLIGTSVAPVVPEISVEDPLGTPLRNVSVWGRYTNDVNNAIAMPPGINSATAIAAGDDHCLALQSDGTVIAWGDNSNGQTAVPGGLNGVIAIAAGATHSVALTSTGMVVAWGDNFNGQTTVPAAALSGVTAIAAGHFFTVALKSDGSVLVWGSNFSGQTTVPAAALSGVKAIAAGNSHVVALKTNATVVAWGSNSNGQTNVPVGLSGITAIAAGASHTLALKNDTTVAVWGNNQFGQVAGGLTTPISPYSATMNPVKIFPSSFALSGVVAIAAGTNHSVALRSDGTVTSWGSNTYGQLTPPAGIYVLAIAAAGNFTVAVRPQSGVYFNDQNTNTTSPPKTVTIRNPGNAPLLVTGVSLAAQGNPGDFSVNTAGMLSSVPVGGQTTFTVTFTPTALGFRSATLRVLTNDAGQGAFDFALGGTGIGVAAPEIVIDLPSGTPGGVFGNQRIGTTSAPQTFTIRNTGTGPLSIIGASTVGANNAYFGANNAGLPNSIPAGGSATFTVTFAPPGPGSFSTTLRVISNDADEGTTNITLTGTGVGLPEIAIDLPAGSLLTGNIVGWGRDDDGEATVGGDQSGVIAITAGLHHTVALNANGTVKAWGKNDAGQTTIPVGLSGVSAIAAGANATFAIKSDGTVVPWGNGYLPPGLTGVSAIAVGAQHTVALKTNGTVVAWGANFSGQTNVPPGLNGVVAIGAGYGHTVALKNDGTVIAWGQNDVGQLNVPAGLNGVVAMAAGDYHTVALKSDGTVVAWGFAFGGITAVPAGLSGVTQVAAGGYHTMALKSDGTVVAWGYDYGYGELKVPTGLTGVIVMAAGYYHSAVLVGTTGVDFGNLPAGTVGPAKTFTIRNTGSGPLSITGVSTLGNTGDYALDKTGMLTTIPAGGQTTFTVAFHPIARGSRPATLRILSDDADEASTDLALTGRGRTALETWRNSYFNSISNGGDGGNFTDYDRDGRVNLVEFGFGLNPRLPGGQLPTWQKVGGNYLASFPQPNGVGDILYGAEYSLTLAPGSWREILDTGTGSQHTFSVPIAGNTRMFWRFLVSENLDSVPNPLLGAVATQSSGYFGDFYPASNALDGNLNNFTHTDATDPAPTWTVTLPFATPISEIALYNRVGCCGERLRNITVRVFSDAAGTVPVFTSAVLNPNNALNSPAALNVFTGSIEARVIRVYRGLSDNPVGDDRVLSLGEVILTSP